MLPKYQSCQVINVQILFRASYKREVNIAHSVELILEGFSIFIFNFYSKDKKLNIWSQ